MVDDAHEAGSLVLMMLGPCRAPDGRVPAPPPPPMLAVKLAFRHLTRGHQLWTTADATSLQIARIREKTPYRPSMPEISCRTTQMRIDVLSSHLLRIILPMQF